MTCASAGCAASCAASSCAASAAACSAAASSAAVVAAISAANASMMYNSSSYEDDDRYYGKLSVNLKGTTTKVKEAKGWFEKVFVGDIAWEEEVVTQVDYLRRIYKVFRNLEYKNVLFLDINKRTIYKDKENKDNDFQTAIKKALEERPKKRFKVAIGLDTTKDEKSNILITMDSKHDSDEMPLIVEIFHKKKYIVDSMLKSIKKGIEESFEVEEIETEK